MKGSRIDLTFSTLYGALPWMEHYISLQYGRTFIMCSTLDAEQV
jgi:hypothetical protein